MRTRCRFQGNKSKTDFQLGAEGSGVVVAVGPGVTSLSVGQAVACNSVGYREYAAVSEKLCHAVPEASATATALMLSGVFSCVAIDVAGGVQQGQTVFVSAGAGEEQKFCLS